MTNCTELVVESAVASSIELVTVAILVGYAIGLLVAWAFWK